jgi:hypothetical protein
MGWRLYLPMIAYCPASNQEQAATERSLARRKGAPILMRKQRKEFALRARDSEARPVVALTAD